MLVAIAGNPQGPALASSHQKARYDPFEMPLPNRFDSPGVSRLAIARRY
jgi:hypothetical protein